MDCQKKDRQRRIVYECEKYPSNKKMNEQGFIKNSKEAEIYDACLREKF